MGNMSFVSHKQSVGTNELEIIKEIILFNHYQVAQLLYQIFVLCCVYLT